MRAQCVIIEWKADDSPISFETFLFTLHYIKPNQLSQRQHAIIGSRVGIFKQSRLLKSKHVVCDYSDGAIEIL